MLFTPQALLYGSASGAVKSQDVFKVFQGTAAGVQTNLTNLGWSEYMVWTKRRDTSEQWYIRNTLSGTTKSLRLDDTSAEVTYVAPTATSTYSSYIFRRDPTFMDFALVTTTGGTGSKTFNLNFSIGMVVIKRRDASGGWTTWIKGQTQGQSMEFDTDSVADTVTGLSVSGTTLSWGSGTPAGDYLMVALADNPDIQRFYGVTVASNQATFSHPEWTSGAQFVLSKVDADTNDWQIRDTTRNPSWLSPSNSSYFLITNISSAEDTRGSPSTNVARFNDKVVFSSMTNGQVLRGWAIRSTT